MDLFFIGFFNIDFEFFPKLLNIIKQKLLYLGVISMEEHEPLYRNLISNIDVDRSINNIDYFIFTTVNDARTIEFKQDIEQNNDAIELNLIRKNAYKEAIVLTLKKDIENKKIWVNLLKDEQKTFSGSKLFYLNNDYTKILVLSIPESMEGKLKMVINRLNKINEKIKRFNLKIKKENLDAYNQTKNKDKKDKIINLINQNLKV